MVFMSDSGSAARLRPWAFGRQAQEKQIHFMVFALDMLALMMAYSLSLPLAGSIITHFETSSPAGFYQTAEFRQVVYYSLSLGMLFFLYLSGHYSKRIPWWSQVQKISKLMAFAVLVEGFTSYAFGLYYSRIFIATTWVAAFVLIITMRYFMNLIKSWSDAWRLPAVIIADANTATDTLYALASDDGMGLDASAILLRENPEKLDREELPEKYKKINVLTELDDYRQFIIDNPWFFYLVALDSFRGSQREDLVKILTRNKNGFALLPAISGASIYHTEPYYFFGNDVMLLDGQKPASTPLSRFLKRGMDITGAVIALAIFIIPMLVVAAMLKLEGQSGTPLYPGTRVGRHGQLFRCWKFRTMEPGTDHLLHEYLAASPEAKAHWERYFKLPNDPRVQTRTARLIRKASIDELPQLWNVLKGDMSLVGPRPILESEISAYGDRIEEYTSVRPGITGLWQASGRNGTSFQRRVLWDSWYVRNWTLWGDLIIILKTIKVVLSKTGAS